MTPSSAERALAVLEANHRDGYTVPAQGLYPYQWCWDSGPIALGWAAAGRWDNAWSELERLLSAQWPSGMVPHIVFWSQDDTYFPGPDVWATGRHPPTTGLTQPPLPVSAAARLFEADPDRDRAARACSAASGPGCWPGWPGSGGPGRGPHGACVVVHPWESGMDNSPSWDEPLSTVPEATNVHIERRDVATVSAKQRPSTREYRQYLGIVEALRAAGWDTERQPADSPFAVEDPSFTAITARAAADLAAYRRPGRLGRPPSPAGWPTRPGPGSTPCGTTSSAGFAPTTSGAGSPVGPGHLHRPGRPVRRRRRGPPAPHDGPPRRLERGPCQPGSRPPTPRIGRSTPSATGAARCGSWSTGWSPTA